MVKQYDSPAEWEVQKEARSRHQESRQTPQKVKVQRVNKMEKNALE